MLIAVLGNSVTPLSTKIGVPNPPYATGDVLAIRHRTAARNGWKPSPTMMAPQMATGVPAPAAPSKNAPNEKPIRSA